MAWNMPFTGVYLSGITYDMAPGIDGVDLVLDSSNYSEKSGAYYLFPIVPLNYNIGISSGDGSLGNPFQICKNQ